MLVSADYSQVEMRVLAHLCRDPVLLGLFRGDNNSNNSSNSSSTQGGGTAVGGGYDIYRQLAARIFSKPAGAVQEEERTRAKVICLGELR